MRLEAGVEPRSATTDDGAGPLVPSLSAISGAPAPGAPMQAERGRPLIIRIGKHLRGAFDRLIASGSLVPNDPVLDVRDFPWTQLLRDHWTTIRDEAIAVALRGQASPSLATISPDHRSIAEVDKWRSFFIWGYGYRIDDNADRCPRTAALVERIPGLNSAFFSILAPGTHIPDHRGVTKGIITTHLGLIVPRDGDVRMRVHDRVVRWAEGETLVFDDTYHHEVWNETSGTRVVLLLHTERPLRQPGKWFADLFMGFVKRSAFVQEARNNISSWNAAVKQLDV
ncbi:aspartyl/asparaginyl beta-hydroxylase domain-containing protein [Sphingomonas bacterium]|uniref:aspartyl/asparaginyl beta-hydroxylase domain-containing protein n=1 Tax=Sphingomonas bacterium TaxID=1895847 RepID=UPI0020C60C15|nr:aspartyl/asparaginyl beta-hydroxylase domain-containing protein [Sphingomonas bacterium]